MSIADTLETTNVSEPEKSYNQVVRILEENNFEEIRSDFSVNYSSATRNKNPEDEEVKKFALIQALKNLRGNILSAESMLKIYQDKLSPERKLDLGRIKELGNNAELQSIFQQYNA